MSNQSEIRIVLIHFFLWEIKRFFGLFIILINAVNASKIDIAKSASMNVIVVAIFQIMKGVKRLKIHVGENIEFNFRHRSTFSRIKIK